MKEIIVVNGYPLSGKDTFMDYCIATLTLRDRKAVKFSSIDTVKQAASLLGWPGTKEDKDRDFLSTLKDLSTQYYDNPFLELVSFCENSTAEVIFLAVREPEEILKLENYFRFDYDNSESLLENKVSFRAILIEREGSLTHLTNTGDSLIAKYAYDQTICSESLEELKANAYRFVAGLLRLSLWLHI